MRLDPDDRIELGHLNGAWGTAGWVKVFSRTAPPENIFEYQPWYCDGEPGQLRVREWRRQGSRLVARIDPIGDRDAAEAAIGRVLWVPREVLPELPHGQWYWKDLIGLEAWNREGECLGRVTGMIDAGVHDVLQIAPGAEADAPGTPGGMPDADEVTERLIPFVMDRYVLAVDPVAGRIDVDWQPDW
ncbi:MAG: ribosome maturation factor RimM [Wenzhouxiangellaceae bacterium]|nr:ribosome maturation factor RimM [Wenzhouxiangellaceae bacterium]